jgi:hypothetical protein
VSHLSMRTPVIRFTKLFGTNVTTVAGSISVPVPTITEPSGDGIYDTLGLGNTAPNFGSLIFFGAGSANQTGIAQGYLWHRIDDLWIPTLILDLTLTLGAAVGVASHAVLDTEKLVKTIAAGAAMTTNAKDIQSPATATGIAKVDFDLSGAQKFQLTLGVTSVTNLNALLKTY